jgi:hypothetical protein
MEVELKRSEVELKRSFDPAALESTSRALAAAVDPGSAAMSANAFAAHVAAHAGSQAQQRAVGLPPPRDADYIYKI